MLYFFAFAVVAIIIYLSHFLRTICAHPLLTIRYGVKDLIEYLKYKKWREAPFLGLDCYQGNFGKGKTLSMVHTAIGLYNRYNDKVVYVSGRGWVIQKIQIVSNVSLSIPYVKLESLQQIVDIGKNQQAIDEALGVITYTLACIDEASVQLNSRNFKSNIDGLFLSTLLQERHFHISMIYSSQKFNLTDKLLRDVTFNVINCNKLWRVMLTQVYDAHDYESASNVQMLKPLRCFGWFVTDEDYNSYNTLECVGNLIKSCEEGDMISEEEIIKLRADSETDNEAIRNKSRSLKKELKKRVKK